VVFAPPSPPVGSKFNKTISLHLPDDFFSQKCGKEMLFRRALYPNLVWQGLTSGTTFIGVGETVVGDQSVRSGALLAVARVRTVGPTLRGRTNQAFFSKVSYTAPGTPLAGYPLRTLPPVSRDESVVRAIQRPGVRP
jgi:hypothetical protein